MISVKKMGLVVPEVEKKEKAPSKAIYNRKVLADVPNCMKSQYWEQVGCDVYAAGGILGFKTSSKDGIVFAGYDTEQQAFELIQKMAKLEIYGCWNIVQHIETGKFMVVPAMKYSK
jgi:hypothetical protein